MPDLLIPSRFCGPPSSGKGGYSAGTVSAYAGEECPEDHAQPPRAALEVTWAALDCVGGWAGDLEERQMVLARMTARIDSLPVIGEEHVVVGLGQAREDRKAWTSSTMYDADGRVVGTTDHLWVAVDPVAFS